jgi:hypothetical protein
MTRLSLLILSDPAKSLESKTKLRELAVKPVGGLTSKVLEPHNEV